MADAGRLAAAVWLCMLGASVPVGCLEAVVPSAFSVVGREPLGACAQACVQSADDFDVLQMRSSAFVGRHSHVPVLLGLRGGGARNKWRRKQNQNRASGSGYGSNRAAAEAAPGKGEDTRGAHGWRRGGDIGKNGAGRGGRGAAAFQNRWDRFPRGGRRGWQTREVDEEDEESREVDSDGNEVVYVDSQGNEVGARCVVSA